VDRLRAGDLAAFDALYRKYLPLVGRVIRDNVHNPADEDDVVQDVFIRAVERLGSLREPERFRPWLLAIARNAAIDHRRARRTVVSLDAESLDAVGPAALLDDDPVELAELAASVRGLVAGLSARDATAITLVTQLGFGPREVATALGVSVSAAKVLLHRARRRLRTAAALVLLARHAGSGCIAFQALAAEGDADARGRHVDGCAECVETARREVDLFDMQPTPVRELSA
jgi:RNA polymerase sigma factor (sigma-70 family)